MPGIRVDATALSLCTETRTGEAESLYGGLLLYSGLTMYVLSLTYATIGLLCPVIIFQQLFFRTIAIDHLRFPGLQTGFCEKLYFLLDNFLTI